MTYPLVRRSITYNRRLSDYKHRSNNYYYEIIILDNINFIINRKNNTLIRTHKNIKRPINHKLGILDINPRGFVLETNFSMNNNVRKIHKNIKITKKKLALLLPGHNEELIIQASIQSAIAAGQPISDIYFVDDNSNDSSRAKAIKIIGTNQVLTVPRSGKAGAVNAAIIHFNMIERYNWVHIADADSAFGKDYFRIFRKAITGTNAVVAVGFVQSLRGNWISNYRALTYTLSQHVIRRAQSWLGMISVFPGPITAFRTSIIPELDFLTKTIAEDFDITLQVHRKKLGRVLFIPEAVNYTQDPQTLNDFIKQTMRWQRGYFQGMKIHKIGTKLQKIDISIGYQMLEMLLFILQIFVLVPILIITTHNWNIIPVLIVADMFVNSLIMFMTAIVLKRLSVLASLPYFYVLRWLEIALFVRCFVEIFILDKFKSDIIGWSTEGRRVALSTLSLRDIAK
ncbi:MAG: glycosyltransferase family 2 protein [bacterium]